MPPLRRSARRARGGHYRRRRPRCRRQRRARRRARPRRRLSRRPPPLGIGRWRSLSGTTRRPEGGGSPAACEDARSCRGERWNWGRPNVAISDRERRRCGPPPHGVAAASPAPRLARKWFLSTRRRCTPHARPSSTRGHLRPRGGRRRRAPPHQTRAWILLRVGDQTFSLRAAGADEAQWPPHSPTRSPAAVAAAAAAAGGGRRRRRRRRERGGASEESRRTAAPAAVVRLAAPGLVFRGLRASRRPRATSLLARRRSRPTPPRSSKGDRRRGRGGGGGVGVGRAGARAPLRVETARVDTRSRTRGRARIGQQLTLAFAAANAAAFRRRRRRRQPPFADGGRRRAAASLRRLTPRRRRRPRAQATVGAGSQRRQCPDQLYRV